MGDLTRNFSRSEFDHPEPYPPELVASKLVPLAERCQWLRDLAGVPGTVVDTFRSPAHNDAIAGASTTSQHMDGDATDLYFRLISIRELAKRALASIAEGSAPAFGQLIFYDTKGHVHVSNPAARLGDRNGEVLVGRGPNPSNGTGSFAVLEDPDTQLPLITAAQTREGLLASSLSHSSSHSPGTSSAARGDTHNG